MINDSDFKPLTKEPETFSPVPVPGNLPAGYEPNILEKIIGVACRVVTLMPGLAVRMFRAIAIVANPQHVKALSEMTGAYAVHSQSSKEIYQVQPDPQTTMLSCTCQDYTVREQTFCKHILAVRLLQAVDEIDAHKLPLLITEVRRLTNEDRRANNPYAIRF